MAPSLPHDSANTPPDLWQAWHHWLQSAQQTAEISATQTAEFRELLPRVLNWLRQPATSLPAESREGLSQLYRRQAGIWPASHYCLVVLASDREPASLELWTELLLQHPPAQERAAAESFAPLVARLDWAPATLFPPLLAGLDQLILAPLILDLANLLVRKGKVAQHPAASRLDFLTALLGQLAERLSVLEEKITQGSAGTGLGRQITESSSLAVSCIDALALLGDDRALPALFKALEVSHRRLQVESAYALARFQQSAGTEKLVELSVDPAVRLRVLAYASELGLLDQIPAEMRSELSRAEGELIQYLAQPTQFGLPPASWCLHDRRTWYWPGFDEPIEVLLFEYSYPDPRGAIYSNLAIVGPCTRAPRLDLTQLSLSQTYAYFAGWQTEHPEIRQVARAAFGTAEREHVERLIQLLPSQLEMDQPLFIGYFPDTVDLVATGFDHRTTPMQPGTLIVSGQSVAWFPSATSARALEPADWYHVVKGERLLGAFNTDFHADLEPTERPA